MTSGINLLQNQQENRLREKKSILLLRSLAIFSIVALLVSALGVFYLKSISEIPALEKKRSALLLELSKMQDKTIENEIVSLKLSDISNIIHNRPSLESTIHLVMENLPKDVSIGSLSIGNKKLSFAITSSSLFQLNTLLENMVEIADEKKFNKVALDGITIKAGKKYSALLKIDLP